MSRLQEMAAAGRGATCGTAFHPHVMFMKKSARHSSHALPMMMAQLTLASWETIFRRGLLMAQGTCSAAEYQRMVTEKTTAVRNSVAALTAGHGHAAVMAPFLNRTRANVRRLRRQT